MNVRTIIASIMCSIVLMAVAQHTDLPRKTMNGKEYYVYKVSKGEGFYSVAKKFDISEEDIIKYNPAAKNGLKRNQVLFIPVSMDDVSQKSVSTSFQHTIKRGETLYAISKMYGVSIDEICELNPGARKRINAGDKLLIPQKNVQSSSQEVAQSKKVEDKTTKKESKKSQEYIYHTIASGETLYFIAQRYNTDVESIMRANPGIKPTKLAKGAVIRVPDTNADVIVADKETPAEVKNTTPTETAKEVTKDDVEQLPENTNGKYKTYCAKKKETFYSIAQKFDIPVDELRAVNPGVRKVKEGMNINIPNTVANNDIDTDGAGSVTVSNEQLENLYSRIYTKKNVDIINVAVMLPFMLNDTESVKSALYTEYYQGFLLAVDSLKRQGYSINVYAYDTQNSVDVVRNLLNRSQMKNMDLIIAPDQDDAIDLVADFGEQHDINVVNSFSMKNEKVNTNARVFQTNIPGSYLYAESVAQFIKTFKDKTVIFLDNANDTIADNDFITTLQGELTERNIQYATCSYSGMLSDDTLTNVASLYASIVFVPVSNKKEAIAEILPALDRYVANNVASDVSLFGYPGWVPQINSNLDKFYRLDTYIFSRFYIQPEDIHMYDFSIKYAYWYNEEMRNASPRYAVLGFDTGLYFLQAIALHGKNFANYDMTYSAQSIQTDFYFERINNWSGFINKAFYFVHLTRDMKIEKIAIQ